MSDILTVRNARKSYGAVKALRGADLSVAAGEVHALCGDNGAGKSTLIKLVSGVERPDEGDIHVRGEKVRLANPHDALAAGIATIHQDLGLAPRMMIYQNIFMGSELERRVLGIKVLDRAAMIARSQDFLISLNSVMRDMTAKVENLSGGQRQAVAICRALRWKAEIIIMDEPTAALGVRETEEVMKLIRRLKENGVTVILISHNMHDVVAVADRVTILRGGRTETSLSTDGLTSQALSERIMGGA
ncbi:ATP-binding cassette domain-containing protein [Afifella marina]|uniref:Monosaccharide ABC transporter ATP-binding protein, CUT2 family n=1 Tax=Afifella marina DSM 2698 TaxID=1120955 RepID=A0A1G5NVQ5_AFIMA|nr:ATP-binding cassette domain-containing protein [Afifella marina]MBK1624014.1 sugar ABC transporter ATP-binding protein [Afifella marina DSM 2698]MBK1627571.1 sugar ABC transporter ATP-binding protein [Afifella marina]MBK5916295.1 ABC transporter ATP-binding protein [Afifella marina]RAI20867.1 ABC transporter ATP-binding protein [Afifella marina DSM 2698]SCZ41412.1 monosaccharide ABC transporter ATP-binding protein, CUT2 family [Afifella marina DSM 2698]